MTDANPELLGGQHPGVLSQPSELLESVAAFLGQDTVADIEADHTCLELLGGELFAEYDPSHESFRLDDAYDQLVARTQGLRREGAANALPRRENAKTARHTDASPGVRLIELSREAGPYLAEQFQTGYAQCRDDFEEARTQALPASTALEELKARPRLAETATAERLAYVLELFEIAGQFSRAGSVLPYRESLPDLECILQSEANALMNELLQRVPRQFMLKIEGHQQRLRSTLSSAEILTRNNLVSTTLRRVYNETPQMQATYRSPDEIVESNRQLHALKQRVAKEGANGKKAVKDIAELRHAWSADIGMSLSERILYAREQLAGYAALLTDEPDGPEKTELAENAAKSAQYLDMLTASLTAFGSKMKIKIPEFSPAGSDSHELDVTIADKIEVSTASTSRDNGAKKASTEVIAAADPALVDVLRTAKRIINGGGKLESNKRLAETARQLRTLEVERKKGRLQKLFADAECGLIVAVLADCHDDFLDLLDRIKRDTPDQPDPSLHAVATEWTSEIRTLKRFDLDAAVASIRTALGNNPKRQKLYSALSSQDIAKLEAFFAHPANARIAGSPPAHSQAHSTTSSFQYA